MPYLLLLLFVANQSLAEASVKRVFGDFRQGALVAISVSPEAKLWADKRLMPVSDAGETLLGIGRDATAVDFTMQMDGKTWSWQEPVASRRYDIQRIEGLPSNKVTPDEKSAAEIKQNNADIAKVRLQQGLKDMPMLPFQWPVLGRISGVYGSQRVLNGQARRPHFGVDIAAPEGTPVLAPADGVVVLKNPAMVLTGQTMVLDHGLGLKSIYVHMSAMSVQMGDHVMRGQQIGSVGKTGRATGPHLHWGMSWFDVQIDPATVTETPQP
jgi:hypothetical protein